MGGHLPPHAKDGGDGRAAWPTAGHSPAPWQEGFEPVRDDLMAAYSIPVELALASIAGRYQYVLGKEGTYAYSPANSALNTLTGNAP